MSLVSVIVPCFCHEKYIESSLMSVYEQSYNDIELIFIDDMSADRSYTIAKEMCETFKEDGRFTNIICLRNNTNQGAHSTINSGVRQSAGEFIAILNSDDIYSSDRVGVLVNELKNTNSSLAFSNYKFVDSYGQHIANHPLYNELQDHIVASHNEYPNYSFILLRKNIALSTGNLLFTRKLYDQIGGFLDLKYCHDWDFLLQSLRFTQPIFVNRNLYEYRVHDRNSFSGLLDVAELETEFVLSRFFRKCCLDGFKNIEAPTNKNYPGLMMNYLKAWGLLDTYRTSITTYRKAAKTVNINTN